MKSRHFFIITVVLIIISAIVISGLFILSLFYPGQAEEKIEIKKFTNSDPFVTAAPKITKTNDIPHISQDDPQKGPSDAKITVIEFGDFECSFCYNSYLNLKKIESEYEGKIRIIWKDFPLSFHSYARPAAIAAHCAARQGKFWEYYDKLFANQGIFNDGSLKKYAKELELDMDKFSTCYDNKETEKIVSDNEILARINNVDSVPYFFINDNVIPWAASYAELKKIFDQELAE